MVQFLTAAECQRVVLQVAVGDGAQQKSSCLTLKLIERKSGRSCWGMTTAEVRRQLPADEPLELR